MMSKAFALMMVCAVAVSASAAEGMNNRIAFMRGTPAQCASMFHGACKTHAQCGNGTTKPGYCPGNTFCCVPAAAAAPATPGHPTTPATPAAPEAPAYSAQGVDVSTKQSVDFFKCLLNPSHASHTVPAVDQGYKKGVGPAITAAQMTAIKTGVFDHFGVRMPLYDGTSPVPTLNNAIAAGFKKENINVYFISFKASEGAAKTMQRLQTAAATLRTAQFGKLWLDVEVGSGYWTANKATNCAYLTSIVKSIQADRTNFPWDLGIYSGLSTWGSIVGQCDMGVFAPLPFWYAAYTGTMSAAYMHAHPMPTGHGWSRAQVVQWRGTTRFCGGSVDFNVYPN